MQFLIDGHEVFCDVSPDQAIDDLLGTLRAALRPYARGVREAKAHPNDAETVGDCLLLEVATADVAQPCGVVLARILGLLPAHAELHAEAAAAVERGESADLDELVKSWRLILDGTEAVRELTSDWEAPLTGPAEATVATLEALAGALEAADRSACTAALATLGLLAEEWIETLSGELGVPSDASN